MKPEIDTDLSDLEFSRPCESPEDCDLEATVAVWCDHHMLDCDYSGFRCDVHRNLMVQGVQRLIGMLRMGYTVRCVLCGEPVEGLAVSDHVRWVPL